MGEDRLVLIGTSGLGGAAREAAGTVDISGRL